EFTRFFDERFHSLDTHATGPERVGLAGVDVSEPEDYVPPLITAFNQQPSAPFTIRTSVPSEFARVVARRDNHSVLTNEFSPIFQGTYSSRIELKQMTRRIERDLLTAEKLGALSQVLNASFPLLHGRSKTKDQKSLIDQSLTPPGTAEELLWRAWEPVLF